jgi:hypothetical protein
MKKQKTGMTELLEFDHFHFKIEATAEGMKVAMEAHGRHVQEGPDLLTISTPGKNLNFKTTFTPVPGPGQKLRCIIAGEVTVIQGLDFRPKDWRAFADKLNTRNARITEKSASEKYIEKTLKKQRAASENARIAFETSGDPQVVINFIKKSPSGAPLNETWVNAAIQQWIRTDRHDLLKSAFLPGRGERIKARSRAIEDLMFVNRIDKCRRTMKSLNEALIFEAQRTGDGNLTDDKLDGKLRALKNKYHQAKRRIKTEIAIQETPESFTMTAFPTKITFGDSALFGEWTWKFPKK